MSKEGLQDLLNRLKRNLDELAIEQSEAFAAAEIPWLRQNALHKIKALDERILALQKEINRYEDLLNSLD